MIVDGKDIVASDYPMQIISNSTGLTFGDNDGNTLGRMLRFQDLNQGTFYDQGIDGSDNYFLEVGNSSLESLVLNPNGNVGINTTTTYGPLDVLQTGGNDVAIGGGSNTGSEVKFLSFGHGHISIYNTGGVLTFANTSSVAQTNALGVNLMTLNGSTDAVTLGFNTTANSDYSTAMGDSTVANGYSSTAMGNNTFAYGNYSDGYGIECCCK